MTTATDRPTVETQRSPRSGTAAAHGRRAAGTLVTVLAVAAGVAMALSTEGFATSGNLQAIASSAAVTGILAVGLTPLMISGNYLSLALGVTLITSSMVFLASLDLGVWVAIAITLAYGTTAGLAQGLVIGWLGLDPIITTIAVAAVTRGVAIWLTDGRAVTPAAGAGDFRAVISGDVLGIPKNTLIFLGLALLVAIFMRWSLWGRELYLLGSSPRAARAAAFNVTKLTAFVFALAGFCAAMAGVLQSAQGSATLGFNSTYDFDAITAVLVGGTAITGGRGSVGRTVVGVFVLATLSDVLLLRGAELQTQLFVKGLIILAVVGASAWMARRSNPRA